MTSFGSSGIEIFIYDKLDPSNLINGIPIRFEPTYLEELNNPGGGSFQVNINDPILTTPHLLDFRNVVQVRVNGQIVGSCIIKSKKPVTIATEGSSGQRIEVSGPGLRDWFHDAVVFPETGVLDQFTKATREFSFASEPADWFKPDDWVLPWNMARQDSESILGVISVACPIEPTSYSIGPGTGFSPGSPNVPLEAPDGTPYSGFFAPGYAVYGSTWWYDAAGFHESVVNFNGAPLSLLGLPGPIDPITGEPTPPVLDHFLYPELLSPGYAVYGYVDPVSGVWGDAKIPYFWWGDFNLARILEPTSPGIWNTTSVYEPAPPLWDVDNPYAGLPIGWPDAPQAQWMWDRETRPNEVGYTAPAGFVYFRRQFFIEEPFFITPPLVYAPGELPTPSAVKATVFATAQDSLKVYMDGQLLFESSTIGSQNQTFKADVVLEPGYHTLAIRAQSAYPGPAGVLCAMIGYGSPSAPATQTVELWSGDGQWVCQGYPVQPPGWTTGEILIQLVVEAAIRGVNSMQNLYFGFTFDSDSSGNPWPHFIDYSFNIGSDLFDVIAKLEEMSCDISITAQFNPSLIYTWNIDPITNRIVLESIPLPSPPPSPPILVYVLNAWIQRGNDHSKIVGLMGGCNVTEADDTTQALELKNSLVVQSGDGWGLTFLPAIDASGNLLEYGRIEGYISVSGTQFYANAVANVTLAKYNIESNTSSISYIAVSGATPWVDFFPGDLVTGPTGVFGQVARRVASIAVSEESKNANNVNYTSEFETIAQLKEQKIERWLKSMSDGALTGSVLNVGRPLPPPPQLGAIEQATPLDTSSFIKSDSFNSSATPGPLFVPNTMYSNTGNSVGNVYINPNGDIELKTINGQPYPLSGSGSGSGGPLPEIPTVSFSVNLNSSNAYSVINYSGGIVIFPVWKDPVTYIILEGGQNLFEFALIYNGQTTISLLADCAASDIVDAIRGLSTIGDSYGAITGTGNPGGPYVISFESPLSAPLTSIYSGGTGFVTVNFAGPVWEILSGEGNVQFMADDAIGNNFRAFGNLNTAGLPLQAGGLSSGVTITSPYGCNAMTVPGARATVHLRSVTPTVTTYGVEGRLDYVTPSGAVTGEGGTFLPVEPGEGGGI